MPDARASYGASERLARTVIRHPRLIAAAWLAVAAVLGPSASRVNQVLESSARVEGSESARVEQALAERFASPFARWAVVVLTGMPAPNTDAGAEVLRNVLEEIGSVGGVTGTFSYLDVPDTVFIGAAATGTFAIVGLDATALSPEAVIPPLRKAARIAAERAREVFPSAAVRVTGEVPINVDLREVSEAEVRRAESRVLPLTLICLLVAFGAAAAAAISLLAGAAVVTITLGAVALLASVWPLSILVQSIVSMIGLGLGIDYALLTVSRFRESLRAGNSPQTAAVHAAQHAGGTIAVSGVAVMIGFAGLLLVPLNELRSIAVGGLIVVGFSVLFAATLLPCILAWIGPRVELGRVRRASAAQAREDRWRRWGRFVALHPVKVLILAAAPVVVLGAESRRLEPELPRGDWLPRHTESALGLHDLIAMKRGGTASTIRVLLELPPGATVLHADGWRAVTALDAHLSGDPRVARVRSLPAVLPGEPPSNALYSLLPLAVRQSLVSGDGRLALLEILPSESADFTELTDLVREVRALDGEHLTGLTGTSILVGGMPAFNADYVAAIARALPFVLLVVIGGTLLALMVAFRSLLIPVKAVLLNLVSVAAAFGAVVLVFQDGHFASLIGITEPLSGVFPAVPIVVFCIVFGLSMDYEVFLVARVAEARRNGLDETSALAEGLARTGGVITSAAAIMVVVFAAFMLGDFVMVKILGFALAAAVIVDATVVRVAIGPALLRMAGRWNWWPGEVGAPNRVALRFASMLTQGSPFIAGCNDPQVADMTQGEPRLDGYVPPRRTT